MPWRRSRGGSSITRRASGTSTGGGSRLDSPQASLGSGMDSGSGTMSGTMSGMSGMLGAPLPSWLPSGQPDSPAGQPTTSPTASSTEAPSPHHVCPSPLLPPPPPFPHHVSSVHSLQHGLTYATTNAAKLDVMALFLQCQNSRAYSNPTAWLCVAGEHPSPSARQPPRHAGADAIPHRQPRDGCGGGGGPHRRGGGAAGGLEHGQADT